jgi:nicotinamide-nucleotide amidase
MDDRLTRMAEGLAAKLKAAGVTVGVAESSAGGLVSASLLSVLGASSYFKGGGVIYTRDARAGLLHLPPEVVTMQGANEDYALIIARAVRDAVGADWGLAETGASGPTPSGYGYPAGHCCVAVAGPRELSATLETGANDREANMWAFATRALALLDEALDQG